MKVEDGVGHRVKHSIVGGRVRRGETRISEDVNTQCYKVSFVSMRDILLTKEIKFHPLQHSCLNP